MSNVGCAALTLTLLLLVARAAPLSQQATGPADGDDLVLRPTNHAHLPSDSAQYWLAPSSSGRTARTQSQSDFVEAVKFEVDSNFARALPIFSQPVLQQGALGDYAIYYKGLAELRLGRPADARRTFQGLLARRPTGYLVEGAALREAESDEALGDQASALEIYERLALTKTTAPDDVLMRMGRAAKANRSPEKAAAAYLRVLYDFPFSDSAAIATTELEHLPVEPLTPGSQRYKLELGRGERLFGAKRYALARGVFEPLRRMARGDDRELIDLRLAECDYFLKRPRIARDGVRPYIDKASRQGEALYFYAVSLRELGDQAEYERTVRRIVEEFPEQSWAEEALNNLATHYLVQNDDQQADATFREVYARFPTGHYAERAAWKVGWYAYRKGRYPDTIRAFESGAAHFPRSDYRPAWLYWSGRSHEALKEQDLAEARYTLVATDYLNSYYGRLAAGRLNGRTPQRRLVADAQSAAPEADPMPAPPPPPPNEQVVRALLSLELYDQAVDELHYAQRAWGDSSVIQATLGWIYNRRGDLRAGINAIKRAYPQYMAAGGEEIPTGVLKVLFPVDHWPLIKRYASEHQLDPYLIAALIAQESTFEADAKSSANAYGLMQILPSTGRQYARTLQPGRRFNVGMLTTAETNIRMGTAYFADLVKHFGGVDYALATYNAGPNRVARWISERPGVDHDEFIDDIPFPETQGYVKKILGTAEDYRRLYGPGSERDSSEDDVKPRTTRQAAPAEARKVAAPAKKRAAARKSKKSN
jgi:soluble lytic murein transglycosylase